jgi:hypothetical protein
MRTMSHKEDEIFEDSRGAATDKPGAALGDDPLAGARSLIASAIPPGVDRRKFIMRSAVISAAAAMNGCTRAET